MSAAPSSKILLLLDGHSVLHRAYHAFPKTLTTSDGELTNAVYGFTRIFLAVLKKFSPEYVAVSFDTPQATFRHQEFAGYKEHRPEMETELASQIGRVHEVVAALGIPIFEVAGYEADDVLGTLAKQAEGQVGTLIVTDDQDLLQVVSDSTQVYLARKDRVWGMGEVREEFGFEPEQLDDYKALRGDPSDNIPGVRGIGPKTAKELVQRFGSLEEVYHHISEITPRVQKLLAEEVEEAALSKKLATIDRDTPITLDLEKCRTRDFDRAQVEDLFAKLGFGSLLEALPGEGEEAQMELL